MSRTGRPPKDPGQRVNRNQQKYPWNFAEGEGWQHGELPEPPEGLRPESIDAWEAWFTGWWAAFYNEQDVPQLRLAIQEFDSVVRGQKSLKDILPVLDRWGITEKGRQDNRWQPAGKRPGTAASSQPDNPTATAARRLRVVDSA